MGRKPIGKKAMTPTERQRRYRANQKQRRANRKQSQRETNARGNEWGTPPDCIALVREVMGGIDLDPATHPEAQQRVQATQFFTVEDDGLKRQWHGRVFLNPPYARGLVDHFVRKLLAELVAGHTTEAVVLVNAQTSVRWFHDLQSAAAAHCFVRGRLHFPNTEGRSGQPTVGQAFFYFGPTPERFAAVFGSFGRAVVTRPSPPVPRQQDEATAALVTERDDGAGPRREAA